MLKAAPKDDMAAFKVKVFSHCLDICFRLRILLILYISVSLNQPARVLGLFLSSYLSEKLGRKRCLVLCSLAQLLSSGVASSSWHSGRQGRHSS